MGIAPNECTVPHEFYDLIGFPVRLRRAHYAACQRAVRETIDCLVGDVWWQDYEAGILGAEELMSYLKALAQSDPSRGAWFDRRRNRHKRNGP